jgi:hypothetical protein
MEVLPHLSDCAEVFCMIFLSPYPFLNSPTIHELMKAMPLSNVPAITNAGSCVPG